MIKLAIIGLGHVFEYQYKALMNSNDYDLVALCDIDPQKQLKTQGLSNIPFYRDYNEMIQNETIDLILISTPPDSHEDIAYVVANNDISMLVEKPVTFDKTSFESMVEKCSQQLLTAFHARYAKDLEWFIKHQNRLLKQSIRRIHCRFFDPYYQDDFVEKSLVLGGSWLDSGVNALSVVDRILENSDYKVKLLKEAIEKKDGIVIQAEKVYEWFNNDEIIEVIISTNWTNNQNHKSTEITFDNQNKIILNHSEQSVAYVQENTEILFKVDDQKRLINHYDNLFKDITRHIKTGTSNLDVSKRVHSYLFMCL